MAKSAFTTIAAEELAQRGYTLAEEGARGTYLRWEQGPSVVEVSAGIWWVWWLSASPRFPHELIGETTEPTLEWLDELLPYTRVDTRPWGRKLQAASRAANGHPQPDTQ